MVSCFDMRALNGIYGNTPPQALVAVLRREQTLSLKLKANPSALILAAQLLTAALHKSRNWPESLAKVGGGAHECALFDFGQAFQHTHLRCAHTQLHT